MENLIERVKDLKWNIDYGLLTENEALGQIKDMENEIGNRFNVGSDTYTHFIILLVVAYERAYQSKIFIIVN